MNEKRLANLLTVDRIYDEPNLSGVAIGDIGWSPDAKSVSYIRSEGDSDELWGFDVATQTGRRLFAFSRLTEHAHVKHHKHRKHHRHWTRHRGRHLLAWRERRVRPRGRL